MRTTARLALKAHRFAVLSVAFGCLALSGCALLVAIWLGSLSSPIECLQPAMRFASGCVQRLEFISVDNRVAGPVMSAMMVLPLIAGSLLGVPIVATELEGRTAATAWSLAVSRRRWLGFRVLVVGLVLAGLLVIPALAATILEESRRPYVDLSTAVFADYGARGPLLVMRGVGAFGIGVATGVILGRLLPGLVATGGIVLLMIVLLGIVQDQALPAPEYVLADPRRYVVEVGAQVPSVFVDSRGHVVPWDTIVASAPAAVDDPAFDAWFGQTFRRLTYGIPGEKLSAVESRELTLLALVALAAFGISQWVVDRRRPL